MQMDKEKEEWEKPVEVIKEKAPNPIKARPLEPEPAADNKNAMTLV